MKEPEFRPKFKMSEMRWLDKYFETIQPIDSGDIEELMFLERIRKSIRVFFAINSTYSIQEITQEKSHRRDKEPTEEDFEQMLKDIDAGKFKQE